MEVRDQLQALAALTPKTALTEQTVGWMDPISDPDVLEKRKIFYR
jgi:hypothetical protein